MHTKGRSDHFNFGMSWDTASATLAIMVTLLFLLLFVTVTAPPAQGQTYRVIYNFTGGPDGANPDAGLVMDQAGNLYGVNKFGGSARCVDFFNEVGCGTVFELARTASGWVIVPLYVFQGGDDGSYPQANLTIGPDGALYGTTTDVAQGDMPSGGGHWYLPADNCFAGCGTVFKLTPPPHPSPNAVGNWEKTILYRFRGYPDAEQPDRSGVTFDQAGNIYLTTKWGGQEHWGAAVRLAPSTNGWFETVIHSFGPSNDGGAPTSGVCLDSAGNLYGTTITGDRWDTPVGKVSPDDWGAGMVFQLKPSGVQWSEVSLHNFRGSDGASPESVLIFDRQGNLFGTTGGYPAPQATAFMLQPVQGGWSFTSLHAFDDPWEAPAAGLALDSAGNLYGTTYESSGIVYGNVFKLTRNSSGWVYTSLHDFCTSGICTDGAGPRGSVVVDPTGKVYGTAYMGGAYHEGVIFEITP